MRFPVCGASKMVDYLIYLGILLQCQAHFPPVIFIFIFFSHSFFFVRPEGEARWSAETCLFCTWRLFGGSGEVRQISLSLIFDIFDILFLLLLFVCCFWRAGAGHPCVQWPISREDDLSLFFFAFLLSYLGVWSFIPAQNSGSLSCYRGLGPAGNYFSISGKRCSRGSV